MEPKPPRDVVERDVLERDVPLERDALLEPARALVRVDWRDWVKPTLPERLLRDDQPGMKPPPERPELVPDELNQRLVRQFGFAAAAAAGGVAPGITTGAAPGV